MKAIALLIALAAPVAAQEMAMKHATGTFEVKITPEAQVPAPADGGVPTSRMALAKTFAGGFVGRSTGTMISAGTPQPGQVAVYVAIDQVSGTLGGRTGGFLLLHQGIMAPSGNALTVTIAPGSGTGDLAGIKGDLTITIVGAVHHYDLAYSLPAKH